VYGTAWQYLIGLLLLPAKFVKTFLATASWQANDAYYVFVVVVTRLFSVAAGTLAIYLTWRLAARLFGRSAGVIAAALLAVSLYHCSNSAFATLDVPMSCLLLLLFLAAARSAWAICGVIAGVLMGMKVVAIIFAAAPLLLIAVQWIESRKEPGAGAAHLRAAGVYAGVASVVLLVTTPHMFFHPVEFWTYLARVKRGWYDPAQDASLGIRSQGALWNIQMAVGTPLIVAFLGGALLSLRKPSAIKMIALAAIAIYFAFWGGFLVPRYVIVVAPLLCVFAAFFYATLLEASLPAVRIAAIAVLAAVLAVCLSDCLAAVDMRLRDTRPRAAAYIAGAIPPGESIGIVSLYGPARKLAWRYPVIDFRRYRQLSALDQPSYLLLTSYDAEDLERTRGSSKPPPPRLLALYDELRSNRSNYRLMAEFVPAHQVPIEFPPPDIRVYRRE
ncbi:MAG TPA: glycosyltransferase family 39 protein, partial [Thermoanaerobaculia bacterium]